MQAGELVFYDESGNSGSNLLDPSAPFFTNAAVCINEPEAQAIVASTRARFKIKSFELKGNVIAKSKPDAILYVLGQLRDNFLVGVCDKNYFLAMHMFGYLVEPPLADITNALYEIELPLLMATTLSSEIKRDPIAKSFAESFHGVMRSRTPVSEMESFLKESENLTLPMLTKLARDIAMEYKTEVLSEFQDFESDTLMNRWKMDPALTCFHALLGDLWKRKGPIDVRYDASRIITEHAHIYQSFVGGAGVSQKLGNREIPFIPALTSFIEMDSSLSAGIQLADVVSSGVNWALKHKDEEIARQIIHAIEERYCIGSILPQHRMLKDPTVETLALGAVVLQMRENIDENFVLDDGLLYIYQQYVLQHSP